MTVVEIQVWRQSIVNDSMCISNNNKLLLKLFLKAFEIPIFPVAETFHVSGTLVISEFGVPILHANLLNINVIHVYFQRNQRDSPNIWMFGVV